jgi:hypothetical protein
MNKEEIQANIRQFATLKEQSELLTKRMNEVKKTLTDAVDEYGEVDGRGHIVLELGDESVGVVSLTKQRRATPSPDMENIERILKEKNLWERCIVMVPEVNKDEVMAASFDGLLSEEEIQEMYPLSITYAFFMNKG